MIKILAAMAISILSPALSASTALGSAVDKFPEARLLSDNQKQDTVAYGFRIERRGADIFILLSFNIDSSIVKTKDYSRILIDQAVKNVRLNVFVDAGRGVGNLNVSLSANELLDLLGVVSVHEVFDVSVGERARFEPAPILLDSHALLYSRNLGGVLSVVEGRAGVSVRLDRFADSLWEKVISKIETLSAQERAKFISMFAVSDKNSTKQK